ncbi:MAG: hypothetical protein OIN86_02820 [Candidatus Methanoperedens sp.]|nr:hypothetical protein [Candidatus Methanoperedens sp.]CAG0979597.1 hypothetical protein METP1_01696 [Methanosarcinales archaeon]
MNDYWGIPEKEYEISILQFAKQQLSDSGYCVLSEKVEVCSGAGALTLTAIIKTDRGPVGLYIHDGPRQRKKRGAPIIKVLRLLPEMKKVEDLRKFVITHQDDFHIILAPENMDLRDKAEKELLEIYSTLYDSKIRDLYETDLSSAADVLRVRLRKEFKAYSLSC